MIPLWARTAKAAVAAMNNGDVVLLQNTRFRKEGDQEPA